MQARLFLKSVCGDRFLTARGDLVEDKDVVLPSDAAIDLDLKERMASMLTTLTPREERIIKMRFGFDSGNEHRVPSITNTGHEAWRLRG
jgi:RNA polymerase primary sigma factor